MNKRLPKIILLLLLLGVGIYLVYFFNSDDGKPSGPAPGHSIEPTFEKEGELAFLDARQQDTLQPIDIEIAEDRNEIQYGMMYRKSMDPQTGMLFIMEKQQRQSFYMKNTYIPLDIIYINDSLRIVSIQENAAPLQEKSLPSKEPALYVLEVTGGFCERHGIKAGDYVKWRRIPRSKP